jgi:hypothetical protein
MFGPKESITLHYQAQHWPNGGMYVDLSSSVGCISQGFWIEELAEQLSPFEAEILLILVELEFQSALSLYVIAGTRTLYAMGSDGGEANARG